MLMVLEEMLSTLRVAIFLVGVALTIKEEFLSLLERDKEFRYAVAGLLGLEEILRRLDGHGERMARIEEELARLREDISSLSLAISSSWRLKPASISALSLAISSS